MMRVSPPRSSRLPQACGADTTSTAGAFDWPAVALSNLSWLMTGEVNAVHGLSTSPDKGSLNGGMMGFRVLRRKRCYAAGQSDGSDGVRPPALSKWMSRG